LVGNAFADQIIDSKIIDRVMRERRDRPNSARGHRPSSPAGVSTRAN
jgi:hypothetical protein